MSLGMRKQDSVQICSKASHAVVGGGKLRLQLGDGILKAPPLICSAQLASEGSAVQRPFLVAEASLQLGSPQPSYTLTKLLVIAPQASNTRY